MSNNNSKNNNENFDGVNLKAIGNYTKNAVKNFENNIISQTDYLEKVDDKLKKDK